MFSYIQQSLGSLSVPILAVVVIGVFSKKVPAIGAKIVLTFGVGLYLVSLLILEPLFRNTAVEGAMAQNITDAAQLSIMKAEAYPHYLHIMGILFVFNVLVMFISSKIKPKKDAYIPKVTDSLDVTPWRYTIIFGIVIAILVLGTYIIF